MNDRRWPRYYFKGVMVFDPGVISKDARFTADIRPFSGKEHA